MLVCAKPAILIYSKTPFSPFCATAQAAVHMEMNSYYVSPVDTENDQLKLPIQGLLELLSQTSKSPLPIESTELAHRWLKDQV